MTLKDLANRVFNISRKPYEAVYGGKPDIQRQLVEPVKREWDQFKKQSEDVYRSTKDPLVRSGYTFVSRPAPKFYQDIGFKGFKPFKESEGLKSARFKIAAGEKLTPFEEKEVGNAILFKGMDIAGLSSPLKVKGAARKELFDFVKKAKPLQKEQAALYTKTKGIRIGKAKAVTTKGLAGLREARGKLAGEMEKVPQFEPPKFSKKVVDDLADTIAASNKLDSFEKISAGKGLEDILSGRVPIKSNIAKLEKVFGPEFASDLINLQTKWQKASQLAGEVLGVPRSLMAGGLDMSYGLRQGIFGGWKHPKQWASSFKKQFGWFAKEENLAKSMAEIRSRDTFPLMQKARIDITDLSSKREEQFISALAEKIPGLGKFVRASGRAYTGFASKFRADIFDSYVKYRMDSGLPLDEQYLRSLGEWINSMTGRGNLGRLEPVAQELATALFSPRYFKSTIDKFNPVFYAKLHPSVRKEAIKTLGAFVGGTLTTLMLADAMPGVDVEWKEPTSANFLKIRIGKTKIDIMGGMQQPMVLAARLFSNKLVSTTTGKTIELGEGYKPLTRMDLVQSFIENKTTPVVSFLIGALRGKTSIGEDFKAHIELAKRLTPIFLQDMIALSQENELELFPLAGPMAFFGAGVQTYGPKETPETVNVTGVKKPEENWLQKILKPEAEVGAQEVGLPPKFEDREVLYKDALRTINNYQTKKTRTIYGDKPENLEDVQAEVDEAIRIKRRMEKTHPEDVFRIELDVYKSGGGMNVVERVEWASKQLSGVADDELEAKLASMLESEVLTKSVAEGLLEKGINVGYYVEGGKIKPLAGARKTGKVRTKSAKKVALKKATMKTVRATPIRKGGVPKVKIKTPPQIKVYKPKTGTIKVDTASIPAIKVKPASYKIKIVKT